MPPTTTKYNNNNNNKRPRYADIADLVVSKTFRRACHATILLPHNNDGLCIPPEDVAKGRHVACLRRAAAVCVGSRLYLAGGRYELSHAQTEARITQELLDRGERRNLGWLEDLEGLRLYYPGNSDGFPEQDFLMDGEGPLVGKANGLTICPLTKKKKSGGCADDAVTIVFDSGYPDITYDPMVHFAIVVNAQDVCLENICTKKSTGLFVTKLASLMAQDCSFEGTATVYGQAGFTRCIIHDGYLGGLACHGKCILKSTCLKDNRPCCIGGAGHKGIYGFGVCEVEGSCVLVRKEYPDDALEKYEDDFKDEYYGKLTFDTVQNRVSVPIIDGTYKELGNNCYW